MPRLHSPALRAVITPNAWRTGGGTALSRTSKAATVSCNVVLDLSVGDKLAFYYWADDGYLYWASSRSYIYRSFLTAKEIR